MSEQVTLLERTRTAKALLKAGAVDHQEVDYLLGELEIRLDGRRRVEQVLKTMTFTEIQAVQVLVKHMRGTEAHLNMSDLSQIIGCSRSIFVTVLQKLRSAELVESKSMGQKGTFVRLRDPALLEIGEA